MRGARVLLLPLLFASMVTAEELRGANDGVACGSRAELALQVLGSGGPELEGGRASAGYLVWVDGHARLLVDIGGGSRLRFGETAARLQDLELLGLTHFHVDHAGDVPALVKAGYFSRRDRPLLMSGPAGNPRFPGPADYLRGLFGDRAPIRYLGGALDGSEGQFELRAVELPAAPAERAQVFRRGNLSVESIGVRHGPVPAVAYRVAAGSRSIVFAGDQDGRVEEFWDFAKGADLLVAHLAIPEDAGAAARRLHATPGVIGRGAATAEVGHLLLSHLMSRTVTVLEESLAAVRKSYGGTVTVADDLQCIPIG